MGKVDGVSQVVPDIQRHIVTVTFDDTKTGVKEIQEALMKGGYAPEGDPQWVAAPPQASPERPEGTDKVIVGKLTREQLFRECPVFEERMHAYQPQPAIIKKIKQIDHKVNIVLFLGTWCGDSVSEVPKLLKVYETAGNPNFSLEIYGVDRAKDDGLGAAAKYGITKVPTILFCREDGVLLGKIVEYPKETVEDDFLKYAGTTTMR